mmetsp:Transcript_16807/g.25406  ORF Transcript_16807/g.25406 Transcript_16807/m.25406 type:complete len:197 (+) Transcript_16807:122-712(+)|eukprot:CAMPEP_0178925852 /NCGR_PEP_ID=MMETSP0786-20121207/18166_1 /TAXON_ID=186022 /ORGANISM="Thalassionema frauenfeldii, Strain CCMP 1798" /LENGTH=196 /DNA_ID=CAMNT_0020600827 /DNA_START=85 /DNA_END=675 /DNA_ORIENTATION=-
MSEQLTTYNMLCGDAGNCVSKEICLKTTFCPCLAMREIAQNVGYQEPRPTLFCLSSYPFGMLCKAAPCYGVPCHVASLAFLGSKVAEKRGIHQPIEVAFARSSWYVCTCYMCQVLQESRQYKKNKQEAETEGKHLMEVMQRGEDGEEEVEGGEVLIKQEDESVPGKLAEMIFSSSASVNSEGTTCTEESESSKEDN